MRRDFLAVTALGSASFLTAWSGQALAGPDFDWAGPYVGASVGLNALGKPTSLTFPTTTGADIQFSPSPAPFRNSGVGAPYGPYATLPTAVMPYAPLVGTFSTGFNYQNGSLVFGLEADASFSAPAKYRFDSGSEHLTVSGGVESLFTLRPRLGMAMDRLLLFGTGGLAFGEAKFDTGLHLADNGKGVASADWSGSNSAWKTGFTLGGGAEYAVSDKLSVKFEALYYDLGSIDVEATGSGTGNLTSPDPLTVTPYSGTMPLQGTVARVGLTFHM
jgi:outer membrane immunogenic protein